jgi:hypothetical protein
MDKKNVLICSVQFDFHAAAVQWALERYGAQVHFCSMPDFTEIQEITASISDDVTHISICGPDIKVNLQAIDSTWIRRPRNPKIPDFVHEADRKFAFRQAKDMHVGMLRHLSNSSFSVNPYDCGEQFNNKVSQLLLANRVGLHIPETIVSNSPDEIRAFFKTHQEEIIYKPLAFGSWIAPGKSASIATTRLKIGDLGDHQSLIACPGIFQRHIPKQFELRVNVLGRTIRAAKLQTQNEKTSVDWRFDFRGTTPPLSDFELPDGISQQCLAFMRESGLVFGCFDFIVDDKGEYVFLAHLLGCYCLEIVNVHTPKTQTRRRWRNLRCTTARIGQLTKRFLRGTSRMDCPEFTKNKRHQCMTGLRQMYKVCSVPKR